MRYGRARAGGSAPEDPRGQRAGTEVDDCHERHHRADEHEHRRRIPDQFLAGGPDDLLELGDDLPDEAGDETEALGLLAAARTRRGTPGAVGAGGACPCGFAHSWSLRVSVCPAQRDVAPVRTDGWLQGRRDSNPQPPVLETGALPIAPLPYGGRAHDVVATFPGRAESWRTSTTSGRVYVLRRHGSNAVPVVRKRTTIVTTSASMAPCASRPCLPAVRGSPRGSPRSRSQPPSPSTPRPSSSWPPGAP